MGESRVQAESQSWPRENRRGGVYEVYEAFESPRLL